MLESTLIPNQANPDAISECEMVTYQDEACYSTTGNSLFQFAYSESLSSISEVGTLNIDSCEFKNFYYDFTSFVGLANDHGHVNIVDSEFNGFSNCGSIIRNSRAFPSSDSSASQEFVRGAKVSENTIGNNEDELGQEFYLIPKERCQSTD